MQLSGNTSYISKPGELLPRRNLQVLQPAYECDEVIDPDALAKAIRAHFTAWYRRWTEQGIEPVRANWLAAQAA